MIVPAGVLVDVELAGDVARALGAAVRGGSLEHSPALARLVAELSEVSRTSVVSVVSLDADGAVWLSAAEAAELLGVSVRTIERRAAAGKLEARREGWRWRIKQSNSIELGG